MGFQSCIFPNESLVFIISTLMMADDGATIWGDDIVDLYEERKRTGTSVAKLVRKLKNVKVQSVISLGPAVLEITTRNKNRGK